MVHTSDMTRKKHLLWKSISSNSKKSIFPAGCIRKPLSATLPGSPGPEIRRALTKPAIRSHFQLCRNRFFHIPRRKYRISSENSRSPAETIHPESAGLFYKFKNTFSPLKHQGKHGIKIKKHNFSTKKHIFLKNPYCHSESNML